MMMMVMIGVSEMRLMKKKKTKQKIKGCKVQVNMKKDEIKNQDQVHRKALE